MPEDEETPWVIAWRMQEERPKWHSINWTGPKWGYCAVHWHPMQMIFSKDPEELNRMMDLVELGYRLDTWPWRLVTWLITPGGIVAVHRNERAEQVRIQVNV
ncbi:MAG: hypothetical protein ACRDNF_20045 [Streptosporangiaceae bacterium]